MPIPYNRDHTRRKSSLLHDLDCRVNTTGTVKLAEHHQGPIRLFATVTLDEIVEAGECIAMVRVPKNFTVTGAQMAWTRSDSNAVLGLGDPFCCGRLLGPIAVRHDSQSPTIFPQGFSCYPNAILTKTGRLGDGCGIGYTYQCDTDLVVTNGYGEAGFAVGGGSVSAGAVSGTANWNGTLPVGMVISVVVDGVMNTTTSSTS